jgi:23S rRNA (uracil1939-C5)-methyltransferase
MLNQGDRYTVILGEMNNLGNAVCHIENMVVFVLGGVTGDLATVEITKAFPKYAIAKIIELKKPSERRIECKCPYSECGGCVFLNVSAEYENEIKEEYVKSVFRKNKIEASFSKVTMVAESEYRNKVVLFWNGKEFGYNKQKSNDIVAHKRCILNEEIFDKIANFTEQNIENKQHLVALFIRKSSQSPSEIVVAPIFKKECSILTYAAKLVNEFPEITGVLTGVFKGNDFALEKCNFKTVYGSKRIRDTLCGLTFEISPKAFYQVNHDCAELLYKKAIELLGAEKGDTVADLFCGTGTIGLLAAFETGASVIGVEIEPSAVIDARRNAEINKIKNIEFFEGDAGNFDTHVDACIVDPPRKGLSPFMVETLLRLRPQKIVYVSCNPDTLARDIALLQNTYKIASDVYLFNMFPRTSHVESVVCLTRRLDNELRERMN